MRPLVEEVGDGLGLPRPRLIDWTIDIEEALDVDADRDQLFRVLSQSLPQRPAGHREAKGAAPARSWSRRDGKRGHDHRGSDNGPGVPEQARAHLFQAFQGSARKGGTGLGLAIAAELVQAHGGEVDLVGNDGGATFRVTIPDAVVELEQVRRRA